MDEGSTEGVGGLTAASDLREAITLRNLASDCAVFDHASPLISEKEAHARKSSIMLHAPNAECDSVSPCFQRLRAFVGLTPSTSSLDAAVT